MGDQFTNYHTDTYLQTVLAYMGHPQPSTPVVKDNSNSVTCGVMKITIKYSFLK